MNQTRPSRTSNELPVRERAGAAHEESSFPRVAPITRRYGVWLTSPYESAVTPTKRARTFLLLNRPVGLTPAARGRRPQINWRAVRNEMPFGIVDGRTRFVVRCVHSGAGDALASPTCGCLERRWCVLALSSTGTAAEMGAARVGVERAALDLSEPGSATRSQSVVAAVSQFQSSVATLRRVEDAW